MAGNHGTRRGPSKDKPWTDALRLAVYANNAEGMRRLRAIAEKCAAAAEAGDMQAIREIGDRLDGKPAQESTVNINRAVREVPDNELTDIALGGSEGVASETVDPSQLN